MLYEHGVFPTTAVHAIVEVLRGYSGSIIPMALAPPRIGSILCKKELQSSDAGRDHCCRSEYGS